jgi:hypothetical protein
MLNLPLTSKQNSEVPTLISSKRHHEYMYSRISQDKILFKKWIQLK